MSNSKCPIYKGYLRRGFLAAGFKMTIKKKVMHKYKVSQE